MNFSNIESIKKCIQNLHRLNIDLSVIPDEFENIVFNGFIIKLCAGKYSHALPCSELKLLTDFSHIQVVIEENLNHNILPPNNFNLIKAIYPLNDLRFKNFSWAKYFCYYGRGTVKLNNSYIGSEIPLQDAYQLIREIYKTSCLKSFF